MAEKHVREIMEKLEEIEKLHAKLRNMVARMKYYDTVGSVDVDRRSSKPKMKKESVASKEKKNSWKQKLSHIGIDAEKLRSPRDSKYLKKLKSSPLDFVAGQWRDKKEKIKNFLSGLIDHDVIFVTRASQTSESDVRKATSNVEQAEDEKNEFPWKEMRSTKNESAQEPLERLLERLNYSRDLDSQMGGRVSIHGHSLGNQEPRRVRKESSLLPEEETRRVLSNARVISINDNDTNSNLGSQLHKFMRKHSSDHSKSR